MERMAARISVQKPECSALAEGLRQTAGEEGHLRRWRADGRFAHVAALRVVRLNSMMLDSAMVKCQKMIRLAVPWNLDRQSTHSTDGCA